MPQPLHMSGAIRRFTTWVGRDRQHLLFLAVQRKGIKAQFFIPESVIEPFEQRFCLSSQLFGTVGLVKLIEYLGHAPPGVVNITLQFAERFGPFYERAV